MTQSPRLQWFVDRVGKRVYRVDFPDGILIENAAHAEWLRFAAYMIDLKYFDKETSLSSTN